MNLGMILQMAPMGDEALNGAIQAYLDGDTYFGDPTTVAQWRLDNARVLRYACHPEVEAYLDAEYKIRKGDPDGELERDALDAIKAAVKLRFPKA